MESLQVLADGTDSTKKVPMSARNDDLVRDAAISLLSRLGLECTNFNSVAQEAGLSNSVLRKRYHGNEEMLADAWLTRSVENFLQPLNSVINEILTSESGENGQRQQLDEFFELDQNCRAALEILAATASLPQLQSRVAQTIQPMFSAAKLTSKSFEVCYVFSFQLIVGALFHARAQRLDRTLVVDGLYEILNTLREPGEEIAIPRVDATFLDGRPIGSEQSSQHELLNACLLCVSRYGFAQSTTRMIAKTAGVSEGKLFAQFPSKLDLFMAALESQIEYGFSVNSEAMGNWIANYGSAVASAILLREYQRANLDEQRAVQIEFLRIAWHREDVYERRNEFVRNTLAKLGVTEGEKQSAEAEVNTMLRVAMSTGAIVVAGLDRTATNLPYTIVTNRIFS